jgi:hypothetical protein
MVIVTGSIEARPETIGQILELGMAHVQRSRLEAGCMLHSVHRDVENEFRVVFIEQWEVEFVREVSSLARRPPEMSIFEADVISIQDVVHQRRQV